MLTAPQLLDRAEPTETALPEPQPMDSSSVLLGLMQLARRSEDRDDETGGDPLSGIVSRGVLRSLLSALGFRDPGTVQHSRRVAQLATGVAGHLSWEGRHLKLLEVAALLHDIGKIGVPDNILLKPGKLSPDEAELMKLHYNIGLDMLQACRVDREVLDIVSQSHVHYGDATMELHLGARILAVSDAYDSLTSARAYREGKSHADAMEILRECSGSQFDGNVVSALGRWIDTNGSPFARTPDNALPPGNLPPMTRPEEILEASQLGHIFSYLYLLESLYDGFYVVDSDMRIIVWSRGAEKLLGHAAPDMLGQMWSGRLLSYADRFGEPLSDREIPMHRVIATGMPMSPAVRIQHVDSRWLDIETQTVPLVDGAAELQGVLEIFRDLSRSGCRPMEVRDLLIAASRDSLTSVANRGELETRLASMMRDFTQATDAEPFSIIFLDVDFFKRINDTFGHTVGDQVLIDVARLLQTETYSGELVGRYGGEEFVILCPNTTLDHAHRRAERIRAALPREPIGGIKEFPVTASFGVTQAEPGDSVESILRRADKGLYMAKGAGRNRTCALTSRDLLNEEGPKIAAPAKANPFELVATFQACIAADMVIFKLKGFIEDQNATLLEVQPNRVVLRLGHRGLLPFWGSSDDRRPVVVQVDLGTRTPPAYGTKKSAPQVAITATVRPVGWVRNANSFETRAKRAVKQLRSFFAGDANEPRP